MRRDCVGEGAISAFIRTHVTVQALKCAEEDSALVALRNVVQVSCGATCWAFVNGNAQAEVKMVAGVDDVKESKSKDCARAPRHTNGAHQSLHKRTLLSRTSSCWRLRGLRRFSGLTYIPRSP